MLRFGVSCLAVVCFGIAGQFPAPCGAQSPAGARADSQPDAAVLVADLGNDSFILRRTAATQLAALRLAAREALVGGLKHSDAEIRRQSRRLLLDVFEADFRQRVADFQADVKGERDHDLPGWPLFKVVVGSDENARKLFSEMLNAEGGLFESTVGEAAASEVAASLDLRIRQIAQPMYDGNDSGLRKQVSLGTSAAILFLCGDPEGKLPQSVREHVFLMSVIQQPQFMQALNKGDYQAATKKLLGRWIVTPATTNMQFNKLNMAMQYGIAEGIDLALNLAKDAKTPSHFRVTAIAAIGQLGGKEQARLLETMLDDRAEVFSGEAGEGKKTTVEVRDIALAWLIFLLDQDHADFGMEPAKKAFEQTKKNRHQQPNWTQFGFAEPARRDEAVAKWRGWVADHPLPAAPERPKGDAATLPPEQPPAPPAAMLVAANRVAKDGDAPELPQGMTLEPADRAETRILSLARELCASGQYAEGTRLLDKVLATKGDRAFQPTLQVPLYRCLKPEAERILGELPQQGRDAYRLHFDTLARAALSRAIEAGDIDAVAAVAARFFHTQAGAAAAFLAADHQADVGQFMRAALQFQRLRSESHDAEQFEPALSLKLAACSLQAGMLGEAEAAAVRLVGRAAGAKIQAGGKTIDPCTQKDKALDWLEVIVGRRGRDALAEGWPMYRGGPTRNVTREIDPPWMQSDPLVRTSSVASVTAAVESLCKENADKKLAILPRLHPLVVGQTIVLRTAAGVQALDAATGKLLWESDPEDSLNDVLRRAGGGAKELSAKSVVRGLRQRLWEDLTFGTLSSDGRLVFSVEGISFPLEEAKQRMIVGGNGRRRLSLDGLQGHNLLTAYDLRTGKLVWEIGGEKGEGARPLAGACFLGTPLPLGGRLYAVARIGLETQLLELDAISGALCSVQTLVLETEPNSETAMFMPLPLVREGEAWRRIGATPSYSDGTLVCQIGESRFAALNLAQRSVRWVYQASENEGNSPMTQNFLQRKARELADLEKNGRWIDGGAMIADGRVLLTPADSNELICLDLADGFLQWTAARRDGLYVGGVADGVAVVIGRCGAWGVRLSDGQPAWDGRRIDLPPGALPSGTGLLAGKSFYLPLTSGEIAVIDLVQGRIVARNRSSDGTVPGNLAVCGQSMLSQSALGLWRFESLTAGDARTAAELAQRKDDPELLRRRGQFLLSAGRIAEAIEHLERSWKLAPGDETARLLADAALEGLRVDFTKYEAKANGLEEIVTKAGRRGEMLRRMVVGLGDAGRVEAAFDACLKLADLEPPMEPKGGTMIEVETGHLVRLDRWAAARLADMHASAGDAQRAAIDRKIAARLEDGGLSVFPAVLGWHPKAAEARLRIARDAIERKQWLEAEQLLRDVLASDNGRQAETIARLAAMLREAKQPLDAVPLQAALETELATTVCLDGKTGRELTAALAADDPVRPAMAAAPAWPGGKAKVEFNESAKQPGGVMNWSLSAARDPGCFSESIDFEIDMANRKFRGIDTLGRTRFELAGLEEQNVHFDRNNMFLRVRGRLAVAWVGDRILAFDGFDPKGSRLWGTSPPADDATGQRRMRALPQRMRQPRMTPSLPGADMFPLVVAGGAVAFVQDHGLIALGALSGKPLWKRDDIPLDSDLVGDGEVLLVTPPDGTEAVAYATLDGRELGSREIPAVADRLWTVGRRIAAWKKAGDGMVLSLVDPFARQTFWSRRFEVKAQCCLIEEEEIGVLGPQGKFVVLDLATGEERLSAQLDPPPSLERIHVLRGGTQYILLADRGSSGNNMFMFDANLRQMRINGQVHAFERQGGKHQWTADVEDQAFRLDQHDQAPMLTFVNQAQRMQGNQFRLRGKLLCIDKRNGRLLFEREADNTPINAFSVKSDVKEGTVEVRTNLGTLKVRFEPKAG